MKKQIILAPIILATCLLFACNKEESLYYSALGTISIRNDSVILESDNGTRMLVNNNESFGNSLQDTLRVIAYFTLADKAVPSGFDLVIDLQSMDKVLFKPVILLTDMNADSIGNDELTVSSLWLVKDYLNLNFMFNGGSQLHYINLVRFPGEIPHDTINLEIRHNDNGDSFNSYYNGFVSFDLKGLRNNLTDSVVLCIKAKEYNNQTYKQYFIYKY